MYSINIIDSLGEQHQFHYKHNEYHNLMELIINNTVEDIGDCKGRAWCGTCIIKLVKGNYSNSIGKEEQFKLSEFIGLDSERLSCQILLTKELHNTTWKILDSR